MEVVAHRLNLLTQIARLLLVMIPDQRGQYLREELAGYGERISERPL